jgi:hypothetical protein
MWASQILIAAPFMGVNGHETPRASKTLFHEVVAGFRPQRTAIAANPSAGLAHRFAPMASRFGRPDSAADGFGKPFTGLNYRNLRGWREI